MKSLELVAERNRKGLRQNDISKLLNLSIIQYGKKERGQVDFTISEVKKLKNILNLDANQIIEIFLT